MKRFITIILCCTIICSCVAFMNGCNQKDSVDTVTVTDMLDETVEVKKNPTKVACVSRTTYDLLIAFGLGDCVDGVYYSLLENVLDADIFGQPVLKWHDDKLGCTRTATLNYQVGTASSY